MARRHPTTGDDNARVLSQPSTGGDARLSRFAAWLLDVTTANAAGAVYGAIMVGVLLAAEDARHEGYPATIEAVTIVMLLYLLTNLYADTLGARLLRRERLNRRLLWSSCVHELPIVEGSLIPFLVLLLTWAAGLTVETGVTAALWATAGTIVILEVAAGVRSGRGLRDLCLQTAAGVVIGLALISLKLVLH
jgi:hypothetical protein